MDAETSLKTICAFADDERTFHITIYIHSNFEIIASNEDVNEGVNEGLSNNEQAVSKVIAGNPTFLLKIAKRVGVSVSTVNKAIKTLQALGVIQREDSYKKGNWILSR